MAGSGVFVGEKQTVKRCAVDSDMHCPKMAVTLGSGWLLVLG